MERLAGETLPRGMNFAWSGLSLEEVKAGGQSAAIFAIASLLSGQLLDGFGWNAVNYALFPMAGLALLLVFWQSLLPRRRRLA